MTYVRVTCPACHHTWGREIPLVTRRFPCVRCEALLWRGIPQTAGPVTHLAFPDSAGLVQVAPEHAHPSERTP